MKLARLLGRSTYPYLPYNYRHKLIFIHVPKCGGTSILADLNKGARVPRYHADWRAYRQADPTAFEGFYKFAVVREPADRLLSAYRYLQAGGNGVDDRWISKLINERYDSFERFALEYLDHDTVHEHLLLRPQYLFLYDGSADCKIDRIIKYENFTEEVPQVFQRLGLRQDKVSHTNRSSGGNSSNTLPEHTHEQIKNLYRRDYDLLGYGAR